jgi:hypothetical protein
MAQRITICDQVFHSERHSDAQIALGPIEPAIACFPSKLRFSHQSSIPTAPINLRRIKSAVENVKHVANKGELSLRQLRFVTEQ